MTHSVVGSMCNVCGQSAGFNNIDPARPRESFRCANCNSSSRNRLLVHVLGKWLGYHGSISSWDVNKNMIIFEVSGVGPYGRFLRDKFDYFNTRFEASEIQKGDYDVRKYADVQNLRIADNSIDVLIASDVFEHVRCDRMAYKEVCRVLKPSGVFLLTIPYNHNSPNTIDRVQVKDDEDIFLLPPVYHAEHTLVYRDYGRDLLGHLRNIGFTVGHLQHELPELVVPRQDIILGTKLPYIEIGRFLI